MMKLNVGQIVYVILEKQTAVHPMQVLEEITKKMLHGSEVVSETDYTLRSGGPSPKHTHLSNIQGEVFESAEHARTEMIERATRSINKHIEIAASRASEWFGESSQKQENHFSNVNIDEDDATYVDLGNGMKGRVRLNT